MNNTINWQPISTAPLDGTDVLVYDGYDVWKAYQLFGRWFLSVHDTRNNNEKLFHEPIMWLPISDLLQPLGHLP